MSSALGTCEVCGADRAHSHYGGYACASCRVFFIRAVQRQKPYTCKADESCNIRHDRIKKCCKACRYAKCCEANMSASAVGQQKREREECMTCVVPYFDMEKRGKKLESSLRQTISVGFNFAEDLKKCSEAVIFANTLVGLERFCENNAGQSPTKLDCNLDVSLVDVLQYPELCCERIPVNWDHHVATDTMTNFLHLAYCRFMTQFVDFTSAAPELNELDSRQKLRLLSSNFCDVGLLTLMYNGWLQNFREGLVFPFGFHFIPRKDDSDEMNVFLRKLISFLQEHVLPLMDELQLTIQEYVILKMIALFSSSVKLNDEAAEIVRNAKNRYARHLIGLISEIYAQYPESWRINRVRKLFTMLKEIKVAAIYDSQMLSRMVLLNIGQMGGTLPFDMHVREY